MACGSGESACHLPLPELARGLKLPSAQYAALGTVQAVRLQQSCILGLGHFTVVYEIFLINKKNSNKGDGIFHLNHSSSML